MPVIIQGEEQWWQRAPLFHTHSRLNLSGFMLIFKDVLVASIQALKGREK